MRAAEIVLTIGLLIFGLLATGSLAQASELTAPLTTEGEIERVRKRLYPGGRDEEDLRVMASLPEATRKTDERTMQREVFKTLFKEEMRNEEPEEVE